MYIYDERTIAANLRAERARMHMTQSELGEATGIAQTRISAFETAQAGMDFEQACAISDALGISLDYLAGRTFHDSA